MISIETETLLTFAEAVRQLPKTNSGMLHPSTIWRWAHKGIKGPDAKVIRLEITKVGGRNYTSVQAIQRFVDGLSRGDKNGRADVRTELSNRKLSSEKRRVTRISETLRGLGF